MFDNPEEEQRLIEASARARGDLSSEKIKKPLWRTIGEFIGLIERKTVPDLLRLKEAKIKQEEAKADEAHARAKKTIAEAAEIAQRMELEKDMAKSKKLLTNIEALEKLANSMSVIRQNGGEVSLSQQQLENMLGISELKNASEKHTDYLKNRGDENHIALFGQ